MDFTLLAIVLVVLVVTWPLIVPARAAAVIKAEQLEKLAVADDLKFDVKQAKNLSKLSTQLDELDEVLTVKDLRNQLKGKVKKSTEKSA
jgi:Tfp pilus assembly protein PilO